MLLKPGIWAICPVSMAMTCERAYGESLHSNYCLQSHSSIDLKVL
jgi:hypothetical protein